MGALRIICALFGIVFILIGIAGYMPSYTPNGMLFGYFEINGVHNLVHVFTGIIALLAALSAGSARLFFKLFGVIYAIVAIVGFVRNGDLYMMHANMYDNYLHTGIAVVALYFGFLFNRSAA